MTRDEQMAYDWAIKQQYQSIAADYARKLAGALTRLMAERDSMRDENEQLRQVLKQAKSALEGTWEAEEELSREAIAAIDALGVEK